MKLGPRFPNDSVQSHTPITFAIAFVARMRRKAGVSHAPSLRTTLAIPRFLTARYFRQRALTPTDYVDAAVFNTPYEDQEIARQLATEVLFPPTAAQTNKAGSRAGSGQPAPAATAAGDPLATLMADLSSLNISLDEACTLGEALETIEDLDDSLGAYEVYDALFAGDSADRALGELATVLGGPGTLQARGVRSRDDAVRVLRQLLQTRIGSLTPSMVGKACAAGYGNTLHAHCQHPWECAATLAALGKRDHATDLITDASQKLDVRTLGKMMMFVTPFQEHLPSHILPDLLNACTGKARDLGDWMAVLQGADFWLQPPAELIERSGQQNLPQALQAADWIATQFHKRFHSHLFAAWADALETAPELAELISVAIPHQRWETMFGDACREFLSNVRSDLQQWRPGTPEPHALNNSVTVARQMAKAGRLTAPKAGVFITDIICEIPDADLFLSFLECVLEHGLQPADHDRIVSAAVTLGIDAEDIYRLLGNALDQLRKMVAGNARDAKRYTNLVRIVRSMPEEMATDLAAMAARHRNTEALAALLALNMNATCAAVPDDQLLLDAAGFKGIGGGTNLLIQWHESNHSMRGGLREKIKLQIKRELIRLSVTAANSGGGSLESGLVPRNELRRFRASDDLDLLNIEETVDVLVASGKQLSDLQADDLFVHDSARGQAAFGVLLDISGSMSGEDLAYCSVAVLLLILRVRSSEIAIAAFESNTHVLKTFDAQQDVDDVADSVLDLQATGGTCVDAALVWAADQFEHANAPHSVLFLLSDYYFSERIEDLTPHLDRLAAAKVRLLAASHNSHHKQTVSQFLERLPGSEHMPVTEFNTLPDLLNATLNAFTPR